MSISREEELDHALCTYADLLYLNGESNNSGQRLKAALEFIRPEAARRGELYLPRFKKALKGWRRMAPTQTRLPMLEFVKSAISGIMMSQGWFSMALFNELTFSTYARPGELHRAYAADVVKRNNQYNYHVIVLGPLERGQSSKTGIFDEVLILDDSRSPDLGDLVVQLASKRETSLGEEAPLWDFTPEKYLKVWRACVNVLQVQDLAISPYQNRHGGASRDHLLRLRSVASIQRRGRWATDSSARIYDKPGRLQQMINKYDESLRPFGETVRLRFKEFYLGGSIPIPRKIRNDIVKFFKV